MKNVLSALIIMLFLSMPVFAIENELDSLFEQYKVPEFAKEFLPACVKVENGYNTYIYLTKYKLLYENCEPDIVVSGSKNDIDELLTIRSGEDFEKISRTSITFESRTLKGSMALAAIEELTEVELPRKREVTDIIISAFMRAFFSVGRLFGSAQSL